MLLAQIEAYINSRPLQALSDNPEDLAALTPGHFLVGSAINAMLELFLRNESTKRLKRWQLVQQIWDQVVEEMVAKVPPHSQPSAKMVGKH